VKPLTIKTSSTDKDFEKELLDAVQELAKWVKVTSHSQVCKILIDEVKTDIQKIVYKNSDGKKTTKELSELSGMDPSEISRDWKRWTRVGIAEQVTAQGGSRGRSLFFLEDFGIDIPKKIVKLPNQTKEGDKTGEQ
jgi:predicted transcriptional regulator